MLKCFLNADVYLKFMDGGLAFPSRKSLQDRALCAFWLFCDMASCIFFCFYFQDRMQQPGERTTIYSCYSDGMGEPELNRFMEIKYTQKWEINTFCFNKQIAGEQKLQHVLLLENNQLPLTIFRQQHNQSCFVPLCEARHYYLQRLQQQLWVTGIMMHKAVFNGCPQA